VDLHVMDVAEGAFGNQLPISYRKTSVSILGQLIEN
jgi:hypothetical protein